MHQVFRRYGLDGPFVSMRGHVNCGALLHQLSCDYGTIYYIFSQVLIKFYFSFYCIYCLLFVYFLSTEYGK